MNIFILIIFLFSFPVLAAVETQDIVPQSYDNKRTISAFNDEVRKTSRRLRELENGIPLSTGTTGILEVSRGGTGKDLSTATTGTIPYFSSTGVIGNVGIGTSGYILTSNGSIPYYNAPPSVPKFIYANRVQAETGTGSPSQTVDTAISSTGDWTANSKVFIYGNYGGSFDSSSGSCLSGTQTSYGSNFTEAYSITADTSNCVYDVITYYGVVPVNDMVNYTAAPNGSGSCTFAVASGNLVLRAIKVFDSGHPSQITSCEFSGIIIREP